MNSSSSPLIKVIAYSILMLGILMNSQGRRSNMRDCVNCPNKKWELVDRQPRMYCSCLGKEVKLEESNKIAASCPSFKEAELLPKHDKY